MVQHRGRQQLDRDDGAGEHGRHPDQRAFHRAEPEGQRNADAHQSEGDRGQKGRQHGLLQQQPQFLRRQVQPKQEQQEDDADFREIGDQVGVADPCQPPRPQQRAKHDVADDQGLPGEQRQGRHQRGAREYQEQRIQDGLVFQLDTPAFSKV